MTHAGTSQAATTATTIGTWRQSSQPRRTASGMKGPNHAACSLKASAQPKAAMASAELPRSVQSTAISKNVV